MSHERHTTVGKAGSSGFCGGKTAKRDQGNYPKPGSESVTYFDQGSFAIAVEDTSDGIVSFCDMFYVDTASSSSSTTKGTGIVLPDSLWGCFHSTGDLPNTLEKAERQVTSSNNERKRVAAAVCVRKVISPHDSKSIVTIPFSLSWDHPIARFGSGMAIPR